MLIMMLKLPGNRHELLSIVTETGRYRVVVEINVGLVSILVSGVVALVVAVLGLVPNVGRIRRLERVTAILKETKDEAGHARLLAVRDRIIAGLGPGASSVRNTLIVGSLIATVGYGLVVGAGYSVWVSDGGEAPAPYWMWAWLVTSVVVTLVGAVVLIVGLIRHVRLRLAARS
jgi:hypothetical protein